MNPTSHVLTILHRCERFVAVDKPAGWVVHRSAWCRDGEPVLQHLRDQLGCHVYPVHRLDRATSGVLLFALDAAAARHVAAQFAEHRVSKRYHAIVRGWTAAEGIVEAQLVDAAKGTSHAALTAYTRLGTTELAVEVGRYATARYSLVEARPHTGRTHQIRRHFAHLRHPIVGDVNYGDGRHNRLWRDVLVRPGLMLRAVGLRFVDGFGCEIEVRATAGLELPGAVDGVRP